MQKIIILLGFFTAFQANTKAQTRLVANTGYNYSITENFNTGYQYTFVKNYFIDTPISKDHAYYIQKSRKQRTAGWVLLGSGIVLSGVGLLVSTSSSASFDDMETGVIIMGIGAVSGITSIPFMIMAHASKNKARLLIKNQQAGYGLPFRGGNITGISLSLPIGR